MTEAVLVAQVILDKISKSFDKTDVIQSLDLTVQNQEFVVLVGPSGCGKSTVLRMIAGLEAQTQGDIFIGDRLVNTVSPKDRDIAMVFQSYALYPHMNVYDNMAFALKMRKTPKPEIQSRVEEAARILNLSDLLKRKPKQLSGGQRQRVALGRAIVRNPQVFLMDEPLSNLDAKLRVQMRTEIQKLHRRLNATTIYVTHDQVEAMTMGDRIVILNQGVIQQVGKPADVYAHPDNTFVGGFIGTMHLLSMHTEKGALNAPLSKLSWPLPPAIQSALTQKGYMGKTLQLGIRPEHFAPVASPGMQAIEVIPDIVETLGYEKLIHFSFENQSMGAVLPMDHPIVESKPLTLYLNLSKCSFFDPQTQRNILPPGG